MRPAVSSAKAATANFDDAADADAASAGQPDLEPDPAISWDEERSRIVREALGSWTVPEEQVVPNP